MALADARMRVVLADDVPEYRLLMRMILKQDGRFEVVAEASDGAEAVRICAIERPDIVLLDLAMPVMDGLQAIPEIRRRSPGTRIVVLSGFARHQLETEALSRGASAYLEKGEAFSAIASTLTSLSALRAPAETRAGTEPVNAE